MALLDFEGVDFTHCKTRQYFYVLVLFQTIPGMKGNNPTCRVVDRISMTTSINDNQTDRQTTNQLTPYIVKKYLTSNSPEDLRLLSAVEPINIDKGAPGAAERGAERLLGREAPDDGVDGAECLQLLEAGAVRVARQHADGVLAGPQEIPDNRDALGAGPADDGYEAGRGHAGW